MRSLLRITILSLVTILPAIARAEPGQVLRDQKITMGVGGFSGPLHNDDWFGFAVDNLGDFDGDGVADLAVGAGFDDDNGPERGAVWILFLNSDGTVKSEHKISDSAGNFTGGLSNGDVFGRAVAALGDLDGDGVTDLAVGSRQDDDGGTDRGAVWILFLNADATVKSYQKISSTDGGFGAGLGNGNWFGISLTRLGDLDGDGVTDLAAGAIFDSGGAVWILFLDHDGTVKHKQKIAGQSIGATNLFGESIASIGDLDGDGVVDLAVGEIEDDDGGAEAGAVWILFLNADGSVRTQQKISATSGGFTGTLTPFEHFGTSVAALDDLDADGTRDVVVGTDLNDDGGTNRGALRLLLMKPDGTVKSHVRISDTTGGFSGTLHDEDRFSRSVVSLGDLDGDSMTDLAVGTIFDDAGGSNRGAVWMLFLESGPLSTTTTTTTTTLPPVCGNGIVESGEECDDGNVSTGDGCSDICRCEEGGPDSDGDAISDPCDACPHDAANDADHDGLCADGDACPLDPLNDGDADGVCGNIDNCPSIANTDQADADADDVGDPCDNCAGADDGLDADEDGYADDCDLCTNVNGEQTMDLHVRALFKSLRLKGPSGNEWFLFNGEFVLPVGSGFDSIDPLVTAVRVRVSDYSGEPVIDVIFPTTRVGGAGTAGWISNRARTRWRFRNKTASPDAGITNVRIDDLSGRDPGRVRIKIRGKGSYFLPFGVEPIRIVMSVGVPALGQCGETAFSAAECRFEDWHDSLSCAEP